MNAGQLVGGEIIADGTTRYLVNTVYTHRPCRGWKSFPRPGIGYVWVKVTPLNTGGKRDRESTWVMDVETPVLLA